MNHEAVYRTAPAGYTGSVLNNLEMPDYLFSPTQGILPSVLLNRHGTMQNPIFSDVMWEHTEPYAFRYDQTEFSSGKVLDKNLQCSVTHGAVRRQV